MIWAGIAAGGFGLAELVGDRSAEAALAGDTASVAAANTGSSFNLTVMGDPWAPEATLFGRAQKQLRSCGILHWFRRRDDREGEHRHPDLYCALGDVEDSATRMISAFLRKAPTPPA